MIARSKLIAVMMVLCIASMQANDTLTSSLMSLVESERAFAAMSLAKGIKAAFLANLADDGILFRPGPVNGKELWRKRPDTSAARLEWAPIYADIAASGDVGYTTGWSIFTLSPDVDQPPYHGYFVTVWKKQPDGTWKFALDLGVGNDHPENVDKTFSSPDVSSVTNKGGNGKTERARISKLEIRFSQLAGKGTASAIKTLGAENIRLYREGDVPSVNRQQAMERLASLREKMTSSVEKLFVASSCDLAYTYGKYDAMYGQAQAKSSSYYVHIWKKNSANEWKLVLDILNPPPKPSK